jgi:hypothetical protein
VRPFVLGAKVSPRGCSRPLQRAITDFAADDPFALVQLKLREHYGFEIGESTIQRITLSHAQAIFDSDRPSLEFPKASGRHKQIVAQIDGGMVPIVEPDADQKDKRKGKKLSWKEARFRSRTPREVARRSTAAAWKAAWRRRGGAFSTARFGRASGRIRACTRSGTVGDGAPWIVGQIEDLFGEQGSYLIDFYHVCEYLSSAAKTIAPEAAAGKAWIEAQKDGLKTGRVDEVLRALVPHREAPDVSDDQAPVRVCHRYLGARKDQLKYREALAEGLPIGSGEIESAHRYVVQRRLKLPGAWWLVDHAEHMLALRINRLNGDWQAYWAALAANPPAPANLNRPKVSPNAAA